MPSDSIRGWIPVRVKKTRQSGIYYPESQIGITSRYCGDPSRRPLRGLLRMRSNLLKHNNLMLRSERRERLEAWAASDSHIYDGTSVPSACTGSARKPASAPDHRRECGPPGSPQVSRSAGDPTSSTLPAPRQACQRQWLRSLWSFAGPPHRLPSCRDLGRVILGNAHRIAGSFNPLPRARKTTFGDPRWFPGHVAFARSLRRVQAARTSASGSALPIRGAGLVD
jgi:hypothetical protein